MAGAVIHIGRRRQLDASKNAKRRRRCFLGKDAVQCGACRDVRLGIGAMQLRLAMWCFACCEPEQLSVGLCRTCFQKKQKLEESIGKTCHHCDKAAKLVEKVYKCSEFGCTTRMRFCSGCVAVVDIKYMLCI